SARRGPPSARHGPAAPGRAPPSPASLVQTTCRFSRRVQYQSTPNRRQWFPPGAGYDRRRRVRMVRYRKSAQSPNIQDRRGQTGRRVAIGGGGLGLGGLLIFLLLNVCMGGGTGGLGGLIGELTPVSIPVDTRPIETVPRDQDPQAELVEYMEAVYVDNDLMWQAVFDQAGLEYRPPGFVFFEGFTESGCGGADERVGPNYCPHDETIYLDFWSFAQLRDQFGARGGPGPRLRGVPRVRSPHPDGPGHLRAGQGAPAAEPGPGEPVVDRHGAAGGLLRGGVALDGSGRRDRDRRGRAGDRDRPGRDRRGAGGGGCGG